MIQTLIEPETFRRGIDKYFELYDGQAVTTEDFLQAMAIVSGRDFTLFKRWYHQAGTPEIHVTSEYDQNKKTFALKIVQSCPPTADNSAKEPFHFPLSLGLIKKNGKDFPLKINGVQLKRPLIEITKLEETFIFEDISEAPILSINRNFTAPIKVNLAYSQQDYMFLMEHDSDPFNRWEAGQELAKQLMLKMVADLADGNLPEIDPDFIKAFGVILNDPSLDNAMKARALILPSESILAQHLDPIDYDGIHLVRELVIQKLAETYKKRFKEIYTSLNIAEPYHFDAVFCWQKKLEESLFGLLVIPCYTGNDCFMYGTI